VLLVLHAYGGGTEKHIEELCRRLNGNAKLLLMTPPFGEKGRATIQIRSTDPADELELQLPPGTTAEFMGALLQSFGVSLVHFHHILGYSFDFRQIIQKLALPFFVTIHDYMLICPRINLMPAGQRYCGEPEPNQCNRCLAVEYPLGAGDIIWWREQHGWLFHEAEAVLCPSNDVDRRCRQYYPDANYLVLAHENEPGNDSMEINRISLNEDESLRIAILGVLARHKGLDLVAETALTAEKLLLPLQFQLIGYTDSTLPGVSSTLFSQTGRYADAELNEKINLFNPHLILFPAIWPETYSYTLSAAIQSQRPIMATNLGAFPERLASRPWSWLLDWHISGDQLAETLCKVRIENFLQGKTPPLSLPAKSGSSVTITNNSFYDDEYMLFAKGNAERKNRGDIRQPGKITAIVVLDNIGGQPSPCAYIRLILPLIRERGEKLDLRWVTPDDVTSFVADVLICQRTAITSIAAINAVIAHCHANQMQIVYDLDDLLLALPDDHPEHASYAPKSAAVVRWILEAHEVWVSTEALRQQISCFNAQTFVIPNYIDEVLWPQVQDSAPLPKGDDDDTVRLLCMGTQTHVADFELIRPVLKRLKEEFSNQIDICLIGVCPHHDDTGWYRSITPPQEIGVNYPAFVNWLVNTQHFDIGLAPLIDNPFNRCKSAIKFLDYSALQMVTVASDINGYASIADGENGFRVKNTEEAWYKALKKLIINKDLRTHLKNAARNTLITNHNYSSVAGHRTKRMENRLLRKICG
jgi:glycosyltransferase involved in cell wall biosynthesis